MSHTNTRPRAQVDAAAAAYFMTTGGMLAAASTPTLAWQPTAAVCASAPQIDAQGACHMQLDGVSLLAHIYGVGAVDWDQGQVARYLVEAFEQLAGDTFTWASCTHMTLAIKERACGLLSNAWWTSVGGGAANGIDQPGVPPVVLVVRQGGPSGGVAGTMPRVGFYVLDHACIMLPLADVGDMRESLIFVMPVCFSPCAVQMISRPRRRTQNRQRKRPWSRPGRQLAQSMVRACAASCLCLERVHMYDLNAIDQ